MKANFKIKSTKDNEKQSNLDQISEEEFEEFVSKAGAAGTFMVFRSTKKDDELGIEEL